MTAENPATLKSYFMTGDFPTEGQFANLIDSMLNVAASAGQTVAGPVTFSSPSIAFNAFTASGASILQAAIATLSTTRINATTVSATTVSAANGFISNLTTVGASIVSASVSSLSISSLSIAGNAFIYTPWTDYSATISLVGGAGNTVPQYSTNVSRYTRIGNTVIVSLTYYGATGDAGAGSGSLTVNLPVTANIPVNESVPGGYLRNAGYQNIVVVISAGTDRCSFFSITSASPIVGDSQSASTREIQANFSYEV